jgi:hypothetical protein
MIRLGLHGLFMLKHYRAGLLIAEHAFPNGVVNEGANLLLETMFRNATQRDWYMGLIAGGSVVLNNADTMASHPGWTELVSYSEGSRPQWIVNAPAAARTLVNAAGDAGVFHFPVTATLAGAFLADEGTKGGSAGILFCTATIASLALNAGDSVALSYQLQVS